MSSVPLFHRRAVTDSGWQPTITVVPTAPTDRLVARWPVAVAATAVTIGVAVIGGGAISLARSLEGRVLPGVVVAGTDLSGLTLQDASARVADAADVVLDAPLVLEVDGTRTTLSPRLLGAQANADAIVALLAADRASVSPLEWVQLRWLGADAPPAPTLYVVPAHPVTVQTVVVDLAGQLDRTPVGASWSYDDDSISFQPHVDGLAVDVDATAAAVTDVLDRMTAGAIDPAGQPPVIPAVVTTTPASTSVAQLGQVLFLDQSEHTLELYEDGMLLGEWLVATGASGFSTPTGEYEVAEKRENPTWGNPAPNGWGSDLPASIGPGPSNPLGVRAINWGGTDHIRFHGTNQEWSLGTDASHGCVRMANDDIVELFDMVHTGTPIISVS